MKLRAILLGLLSIGYSGSGSALFSTGEDLYLAQNACYSNNESAQCVKVLEFISAVVSTALASPENKPFCLPDRVGLANLDSRLERYLKQNRSALDDPAAKVVIDALKQAYPCEGK